MPECASCSAVLPDGAKFCSECGTPVTEVAPREQRKTVTVVFCDVVGSTSLGESTDPEALRAVLARYFDSMKGIVERHGGTVEKFIGDAVMAVFGVPVVHEDDALRACRAAIEMRDALPELTVRGRIGVHTGEVVVGTAERLATGDTVNVAARLEQAAEPGEILVGSATRALLRDAVDVGDERRLDLKGKAEPVPAFPLLAVVGEGAGRRTDVPFVGRERERRTLFDAWSRAQSERSAHLFTLLGAAGVGKSRLAAEFLAEVDAPVATGRCLSYGEGITYSPIVQIVSALGRRPSDTRAAAALASVLGESDDPFSAVEIAWAFRILLEEVAPVIVVFDDLHWAEPTLLDLVDVVADLSRDASILLLCMSRPELLDSRPTWGGGKLNATTVLLQPLGDAETDELIDRLGEGAALDASLRDRIRRAAGGNPLFVEEMLRVVADSDDGEIAVPLTIQALLSARLDQLDPTERSVLERGAIEGQVFHRGGVEALGDDRDVMPRLMSLVRKELVRPDRAAFAGDDGFRFRHLLIRDAAYDALPKGTRAELHERFAAWLSERAGDLVEYDEIAGYHLEQAARFRSELGTNDEKTSELLRQAAEHLRRAGERAFARRDMAAATTLLTRAVEAEPGASLKHELALVDALGESGDLQTAIARADAIAARGAAAGDRRLELRGRLASQKHGLLAESTFIDPRTLARETIPVFEAAGDDSGLSAAWLNIALGEHFACQIAASHDALTRAVDHAVRAGDLQFYGSTTLWRAAGFAHGPTPVEEALAWFDEDAGVARAESISYSFQGVLEAMRGNVDRGRELVAHGRAHARELGQHLPAAGSAMHAAYVELLAGDPEAAAAAAAEGESILEAAGENGWRSTVAAYHAEALYQLGLDDESWAKADVADRAAAPNDVITQVLVRIVRAKVIARRGEPDAAEQLAREAVALIEPTDMVDVAAETSLGLACILADNGKAQEARRAFARAEELFSAKGHVVGVQRVTAARAALEQS